VSENFRLPAGDSAAIDPGHTKAVHELRSADLRIHIHDGGIVEHGGGHRRSGDSV
jgi:predicted amino acid dehydrogenase